MAGINESKRRAAIEAINDGDFGHLFDWLREYDRMDQLRQALGQEPVEQPPPINLVKHTPPPIHADDQEYRVVVLGDCHDDPRLRKDRFFWMGRVVREQNPDAVVQIGDFATLDSMCKYPPQSFTEMYSRSVTVKEDLRSFREALDEFERGLDGWQPKHKHVTFGNHEARMFSGALRAQEQRAGFGELAFQEYVKLLNERQWTYSDYGDPVFLGGVGFVHVPFDKMGKPYGGKTAERRIAQDSRYDIVMGHSHEYKIVSEPKIGGDFTKVLNVGCTLPEGHVENYAKHANHGWSYGVACVTIRNGHIKDHSFTTMEVLEACYGEG
jgi:hypothetical protein